MIYITQLIYIHAGQEAAFDLFEAAAIPLIQKYGGSLLLRVRPDAAAFVEAHMEPPYEIHLVTFNTHADFGHFLQDEERKQYLSLKEQSIRSVLLLEGVSL